jgi:hypothetical protein
MAAHSADPAVPDWHTLTLPDTWPDQLNLARPRDLWRFLRHALGLHTSISRVQGGKLKAKKEIRIASLFREAAPEFLKMIVVHELAHLKESDHNKAFYRLCEFMQPGYHQIEFDLRLYLTYRDLTKNQT